VIQLLRNSRDHHSRGSVAYQEAAGSPSAKLAPTGLKLAIAIATAGRREVLSETVQFMKNQARPPDEFLLCPAKPEDADAQTLGEVHPQLAVVPSSVGLCRQRNALIAASQADIMVFFDDDFLPAADFLAEVEKLFLAHPDVVIATGLLLADGSRGAGMETREGEEILALAGENAAPDALSPVYNAYGCNMVVRLDAVRRHGLRFDEDLPLYAWLEDVDFSRAIAAHGRVVKSARLRGVHLGTKKAGRSPGRRLGYSQIANRVYIMRKGNMSARGALGGAIWNVSSNLIKSLRPEPWADRRGRLAGNLIALWDLVRGRVDPARILKM
jgi:GT2 family glycosyltransferase